ncbi:MAG: DUF4349 domain-containing protein [Treponema sp.]|nr:DUF4349 domain-containing protein [Treponema sp.]
MKYMHFLLTSMILAVIMLCGCAKASGSYAKNSVATESSRQMMADFADADFDDAAAAQFDLPQERKLIRTGNIRFEVQSLAHAKSAIELWVKKYGGYISDTSESNRLLHVTAHIPSTQFLEAMSDASGIGKVVSKNINSIDVTDVFYDLNTRLATRRILLERLQSYLREAKNVEDMLAIESKINDVTTEIERMQGQFNRLSQQIDYSEIFLEANLPYNHEESGFIFPDMKSSFIAFSENVLSFFSNLIFVVLYIIIFGVPIVLIIFLLYWICFGKIGLLRRLFKRIRVGKKEK